MLSIMNNETNKNIPDKAEFIDNFNMREQIQPIEGALKKIEDIFKQRQEEYLRRIHEGDELKASMSVFLPDNSTPEEESFIFACLVSAQEYDDILSKEEHEAEKQVKILSASFRSSTYKGWLKSIAYNCISAVQGYNKRTQEEKKNAEIDIPSILSKGKKISTFKIPKGILDLAMNLPPMFYTWSLCLALLLEKQSKAIQSYTSMEDSTQNMGITPLLADSDNLIIQTAYYNNIPIIEFNIETLIRYRKNNTLYKIGGKDYKEPEKYIKLLEENCRVLIPSGRYDEKGNELFDDLPLVIKQRTAKDGSIRGAKILFPKVFYTQLGFNNAPLKAIPDKDPSTLEIKIICYFQKIAGSYNNEPKKSGTYNIDNIIDEIEALNIPHYKKNGKKKLKNDFIQALENIKKRGFPFIDYSLQGEEKIRVIYQK